MEQPSLGGVVRERFLQICFLVEFTRTPFLDEVNDRRLSTDVVASPTLVQHPAVERTEHIQAAGQPLLLPGSPGRIGDCSPDSQEKRARGAFRIEAVEGGVAAVGVGFRRFLRLMSVLPRDAGGPAEQRSGPPGGGRRGPRQGGLPARDRLLASGPGGGRGDFARWPNFLEPPSGEVRKIRPLSTWVNKTRERAEAATPRPGHSYR